LKQKAIEIHHLLPEEFEYGEQNGFVYHYTNLNALINILNSKSIWLTAFHQLNDLSEGRLLFEEIIRHLKVKQVNKIEIKLRKLFNKIIENAYVVSFCSYGNKLSQWRGYGNINVGFNYELISNGQYFIVDKNGKHHYTSGLFFSKCDYINPFEKQSLEIRIEESLNNFKDLENANIEDFSVFQYNALKLGLILFPVKHIGFLEESEYRAVHYLWNVLPFNHPCKDKLFIKLLFDTENVKRIVVGPSVEQPMISDKIIAYIEENNSIYGNVEVYNSKIPYLDNS